MDITRIINLVGQLDEHLARYQELINFLEEEKKCLLSLDLNGLFVTSQAKEKLGRNIQDSISFLITSLNDCALMLGIPLNPQPTLTEIANCCPKPYDNQINNGSITLARLKNIILRENTSNQRFVQEALNIVNESINIMTGADQLQGEGYKNDGSKERGVKKALPSKLSKEV